MARKIMLNRVITEIKNSSVKKLRQRDTHLLIKRSRVEKFVDLGFLREILYASLTLEDITVVIDRTSSRAVELSYCKDE